MSELTRTEKFLRACIDGVPCELKPLTRVEKLLAELNETLAGPAPVVILPETEFTETEIGFVLTTPLSNTPTNGATAAINYNGVKYTSPIIYNAENAMFVMGNTAVLGIQGGNEDAPFAVGLAPSGVNGEYAMVMPLDGATSVTLSIVQTEGASADSGSGGGMFIVKATAEGDIDENNMLQVAISPDKTYTETRAAFESGQLVMFHLTATGALHIIPLTLVDLADNTMMFYNGTVGGGIMVMYMQDGQAMAVIQE